MKKIKVLLLVAVIFSIALTGNINAWEPPEDFDWETPYNIKANCGGGCQVQFGLVYLDNTPNYLENNFS